jgi:hypothetical protein
MGIYGFFGFGCHRQGATWGESFAHYQEYPFASVSVNRPAQVPESEWSLALIANHLTFGTFWFALSRCSMADMTATGA